ncbi:MAG: primosomal protein N' [Candidatus Buchananbacteria bacterium]|nr:primosomal protein N' [Candidatus Buchananbacteria bacterium]
MKKNKIAQIIPVTRLKRDLHLFDYIVPDDLINRLKRGQLVEIPFRNKQAKGIIFDLVKDSDLKKSNLKSIDKIVEALPFLNNWQLKLIKFLADYYFVSMSVWAKMIVPEIPKRKRKSSGKILADVDFLPIPSLNKNIAQYLKPVKPVFLRYFNFENKIKVYLDLIDEMVSKNKQVVIIVPQISDIKDIYKYLLEYKNQVLIFLNDLPKNKYWQEWLKIKKGEAKVIIGTRSAIFAPFKNLGAIIIDQEESENHKQEEPNPRYNAKTVALKIKELINCKLFFVSAAPSLNSLYNIQQKKWQYFEIDKLKAQPEITIIDKQEEFRKGNYSIFSEELLNKVEYNLKRAKKIFLFLNRKGFATLATCQDCGEIAICPHCNLPLTLHSNKKIVCHHCGFLKDLFLFCPKCKGSNIKLTGTGTEKVEIEIKKMFPTSHVLKLDLETPLNDKDLNNSDIIIGTCYAFDQIDWQLINLIGVINADTLFYLPDFRAMEKTFNLLVKLTIYLSDNQKQLLIQTMTPDNYVFKSIKKLDYKSFYINEIKERQNFNYPPISKLIRLIYQNFEFNAGQKEIEQIYHDLIDKVDNKKISISSPLAAYTQQVRGRWRWQIIIKIIDKEINLDFLNNLPENVIIDVEPVNLL